MRVLSSDPEPQLSYPPTPTPTCNSHTCIWKPYPHSNDFAANLSLLLIILLSSFICVLSLHAALRCFLRPVLPTHPKPHPEASVSTTIEAPTLLYSPGLKLAGTEAECIICLSEFHDGDTLRVLDKCKHGFHLLCIQQWLSSHSSCPTCRTNIFSSPPDASHDQSTNVHVTAPPQLHSTSLQATGIP